MIISYSPIHHEEADADQLDYEKARAKEISRLAARYGVHSARKDDGDTSYQECRITLPSLSLSETGAPRFASASEEYRFSDYTEFLMDLEDRGVGPLLHEVHTEAEMALLKTLRPSPDDSPSLSEVDIHYRHG